MLRKVAGAALRYLKSRSIRNFVFLAREEAANTDTAQALAEGFITANFETDKYKTEKKDTKEIQSVRIAGYSESEKSAGEKGLAAGKVIAESQNFTRDLNVRWSVVNQQNELLLFVVGHRMVRCQDDFRRQSGLT